MNKRGIYYGMIVAVGGGDFSNFETLEIDEYIVKSIGIKNAKALFIPTASNDSSTYIESFNKIYGEKLGCTTESLLLSDNLSDKEIEDKILSADLIYVGGGNTKKMLKI